MNAPDRFSSPEERELDRKRNELAALKADVVEQELRLSTLQAELAAFKTEYLRVVGVRYAEFANGEPDRPGSRCTILSWAEP